MPDLISIITAADPSLRNRPLDEICSALTLPELLEQCSHLEQFRRTSDNLYHRVRALFFLYAIHRFYLPPLLASVTASAAALIPFHGYEHLLKRRFEEAIDSFLNYFAEFINKMVDGRKLFRTYYYNVLQDQSRNPEGFREQQEFVQRTLSPNTFSDIAQRNIELWRTMQENALAAAGLKTPPKKNSARRKRAK